MFHLRVQQIDQFCLFDLSWGQGPRLSATLAFPAVLRSHYQEWQSAYLTFYQNLSISHTADREQTDELRGRGLGSGSITTPIIDWHAQLVKAEAQLLYEFHQWLRQRELFELRDTLITVSQSLAASNSPDLDLFLTCTPTDLARLPWEAWELSSRRKIRISRVPEQIRHAPATQRSTRLRPRILVILGSDSRQTFGEDWQQVARSLHRLADVPAAIGWQDGQPIEEVKNRLREALTDRRGWDGLVFAGHSSETLITGGELGIAPGRSIQISELVPQLDIAVKRGLQFALFNSCNGLAVAESLIDLGLNQVLIMREPVHNQVAQEFLMQFMGGLAAHQDVHESLLSACQQLKTEKNLTYPSAHLIPSLFRYPQVDVFQIQPSSWHHWLKRLMPQGYEAWVFTALLLCSWQLPVQQWLLERRVLVQAMYRQFTHRIENDSPPPVLLVQIDNRSITERGITNPNPIPHDYLADLVRQVAAYRPAVVGVDYLLDRPQPTTPNLVQAVQAAIAQGTQFVFAAYFEQNTWQQAIPDITHQSVSGDINIRSYYMDVLYADDAFQPFAYVLAEQYWQLTQSSQLVQNLRPCAVLQTSSGECILADQRRRKQMERSPITFFSYRLGQRWLDVIMDYSLPPQQIYTTVPAWKLQQPNLPEFAHLSQQVVLIVPGGYADAGIKPGDDNFPAPLAVRYWYQQENPRGVYRNITGGEIHAYKLHHWLRHRYVVSIPDVWMVLLAAGVGKVVVLLLRDQAQRQAIGCSILAGSTVLYGFVSLELYLSSNAILLPIILPSIIVWLYVLPVLVKNIPRQGNPPSF